MEVSAAQADLLARVAALERDLQNERASVRIGADAFQQVSLGREHSSHGPGRPISKGKQQTPDKLGPKSLLPETSNDKQQTPLGLEGCKRSYADKRSPAGISQESNNWSQSTLGLASNSSTAKVMERRRFEIDEELTQRQFLVDSVAAAKEENLLLQKELDAERSGQLSMLAEVRDCRNETEELSRDLNAQIRIHATSDSDTAVCSLSLQQKLLLLDEQLKALKENLRQKRSELTLQRERCIAKDKEMSDDLMQKWHELESSRTDAEAAREKLALLTAKLRKQRAGLEGQTLNQSEDTQKLQKRIDNWQQCLDGRQQRQEKNRERLQADLQETFARHQELREEFLHVQGDKYVLLSQVSSQNQVEYPFEPSLTAGEQGMMEHCVDTFRHWWSHQNSELEEMHNCIREEVNVAEHERAQVALDWKTNREGWASERAELEAACEAADEELSELRASLEFASSSKAAVPEA